MADYSTDTENLLEAALNQAFNAPPSRRQPVRPENLTQNDNLNVTHGDEKVNPIHESANEPPPVSEDLSQSEEWKVTYEGHVQEWRAQSAEAREKAEQTRARWEAIRDAEKQKADLRKAAGVDERDSPKVEDWEAIAEISSVLEVSPIPADTVSGEHEKSRQFTSSMHAGPSAEISRTHSQLDTADGSQKWEDVHSSVTSSFPSMSFPERTETPSPVRHHPAPEVSPLSATLSVFDSTLSTRTRVTALVSSLVINLLLPFVNGVMLGFGEIFAKNFIGWFGWKPTVPGSTAATAGIGISSRGRRDKK